MANVHSKVIAITGASGGIGAAAAALLSERGAKIVLGARRGDQLQALTDRLLSAGGEAACLVMDVKKRDQVAALVALALERFGRLDVFINNAGIGPISLLDQLRVEDWDEMIDVNIRGSLYGIAAALPVFRAQAFGQFINVLSTAGLTIKPTMAVYSGTKQAMRAIAEGLRIEAGPHLRVTNISPGFVQTNFADSMTDESIRVDIRKRAAEIGITPDAIARAIAFAIDQPQEVEISDIVVRPTAQA